MKELLLNHLFLLIALLLFSNINTLYAELSVLEIDYSQCYISDVLLSTDWGNSTQRAIGTSTASADLVWHNQCVWSDFFRRIN